jgi:flavodoxin
MANCHCQLLIIYGSQTGQAKSIAEDVKLKAEGNGYDVQVVSMDESIKQVTE